jgi:uncharacterized protein YndB with AHSA1/START domain
MRPISVTVTGLVAAPIERVFDLLTDPKRMPDWFPGCQSVLVDSSPGRKGERWRLRLRTPTRIADIHLEILEYTPPTNFAWLELLPRSGTKTYFKLQSQGGSTEVTIKHAANPPTLGGWMRSMWFRRRNMRGHFEHVLLNLGKLLSR